MSARLAQNWWAIVLRGVIAILFGIIAILTPGVTILALTLLFAIYMLADGILAIVAAIWAARHHERWGWLVLEGIADLIAGNYPDCQPQFENDVDVTNLSPEQREPYGRRE